MNKYILNNIFQKNKNILKYFYIISNISCNIYLNLKHYICLIINRLKNHYLKDFN